jgi:hypothetical protein
VGWARLSMREVVGSVATSSTTMPVSAFLLRIIASLVSPPDVSQRRLKTPEKTSCLYRYGPASLSHRRSPDIPRCRGQPSRQPQSRVACGSDEVVCEYHCGAGTTVRSRRMEGTAQEDAPGATTRRSPPCCSQLCTLWYCTHPVKHRPTASRELCDLSRAEWHNAL